MNVAWTEDFVRRAPSVDLGLAVAAPSGLVSPVLRGLEKTSLAVLAERTRDLVERARQGHLRQEELEGGSSTITNLGMYGTEDFIAIINPPQTSILAVGAVRKEPIVTKKGRIRARSVVHLVVSVDHRPIDGATAAEWMQALIETLEKPLRMLV
jgi:pyruvate dehydrogenase E2 component (dihydrolipoamide acetyltransferase)